ncbi:TetR/AcrR family transcriptional regulator [Phreatobacter stygius]|uniref:TetR/AcrR family transcriptional regulator n=1 Tax=Phreatobacter stygius TaxID=1940610 RepID=A0A4D7AYB2_9HYPH|nr:TetR/AcrR family transcriptional regulator [Phreatobacter stygius]QCI63708.1 TetR/AcrR family transcriptional regulator [Phreatobacter stygius]
MAKASKPTSPQAPRDAIVAAYMALLAEKAPHDIGLAEIAEKAGVSLAVLRGEFGSKFDILAAFVKTVDTTVLEGIDQDLAEQPTKEKLFDILMRRLDVLAPHKAAIGNLARAARRDGGIAMGMNRLALRSHQWMLAAAGVETGGPGGALRAQGMAVMFARVMRVWLDDDDPALAKTMKALDEGLTRAGRAARALDDVERIAAPFKSLFCAPRSFCSRRRSDDREQGREPRPGSWRGDDFRDPNVTPV